MNIAITIILVSITALASFLAGITYAYEKQVSGITEQQYYEQSLQYLEDIRNSNDDIFSVLVQ